ncbi:class I SAM-dependent methyltransferase [Congregibacter variabilis]|uniref:Ribosomal RNA small subunit methyltransferase J n=1 Tax=Congregibacter variabilis TaxID=3081200 RepID=A0ABZ0I238_9GAMM|nr:class I SAM-dependent methyltransferase [Congregibacter sp. IMCC43200]
MGVVAASLEDRLRATQIAEQFDLPLLDASIRPRDLEVGRAVLQVIEGVLSVQLTGRAVPGPVTIDFSDKSMANRRRGGHNELLGKAVGWKQARAPGILDATGGYGRDAFLLADLGCEVTICERDPIMALLFREALSRASASEDQWLASVVERMQLLSRDAIDLEATALKDVEVIYLDPMFPLDRRAAPAKEMQVLHQLLAFSGAQGDVEDAALLAWARAQDVRRVVVKRPRRAPVIPGAIPGHCLTGKSVRFDVYPVS